MMSEHQQNTLSDSEILGDLQRRMGKELGKIHNQLSWELIFLCTSWEEYKALFGKKKAVVDTLNTVAPSFFGLLQEQQRAQILLHICRLTDRAKNGKYENLTIALLPNKLTSEGLCETSLSELKREVSSMVDETIEKSSFARGWRNKELAHKDLLRTFDKKSHPLEEVTRQNIEETCSAVGEILNHIDTAYGAKGTTLYRRSIKPLGGAETLAYRLKTYLDLKARRAAHQKIFWEFQSWFTKQKHTLPEEAKNTIADFLREGFSDVVEDIKRGISHAP